MLAAARTPRRDRIAIGTSIAVHLCVLTLVALTFPRVSFSSDDPDERILLTQIAHIQHRAPTAARPAAALSAVVQRTEKAPVIHAAVTHEHAARQLVVAREERAGATVVALPSPTPVPQHASPAAQVARAAVPADVVAPTPQPAVTSAPTTAPAQREDGIGNFSETYPASIDPALRSALFAGINGAVVRITVDENGRATSVEFVRSPADATLRDELRTRILATRFTPASCNGLRCAGTVELRS